MRSVFDRLAARFPGGPHGNRSLTAVVSAHALAHLSKLRRFAFADWARGRRARGHILRRTLVGFALITGASLAVAAVEATGPWIQAINNSVGA